MLRAPLALALAAAASALVATSAALAAPPPPDTPLPLALDIQKTKLDNGLVVVLNPDHASPTVAVAVVYDVGSRDDERGKTGFAHLFEHMMFQGSKNAPKGEHVRLVTSHGGNLNAYTDVDRTTYYELLPASELALGLWLEADRMKALDVTSAGFENQRSVVEEEYRMRYSNVPYRLSTLKLDELVYQGYWPYEHSTIGSMKDLEDAKLETVAAFHARHYAPNLAVLSISGDFDPAEALALAKRYFGGIPRVAQGAAADAKLAPQTSARTVVVRDEHARSPMVQIGWATPPYRDKDHAALEVAARILGGGESSRLHQLLVRDKASAQSAWAQTRDRRGPDLFVIGAKLAAGAKALDVEKIIDAEVRALATTRPPTDAELTKAKRQLQAAFVLGLQSNFARATQLGETQLFYGDAALVNHEMDRVFAVTKDDVKRVALTYLTKVRSTTVETTPPDGPAPAKNKPKGRP